MYGTRIAPVILKLIRMLLFMRILILLSIFFSFHASSTLLYSDKDAFVSNHGSLVSENWQSYPTDTVLTGQTFKGVTYNTPNILVGALRGPSWRLGFSGGEPGRYRSFSSTILDFDIFDGARAFGVSLSQGNQNGGMRREGTSIWDIVFDSTFIYTVSIDTTDDDFSGEAFFGISGLAFQNVRVRRVFSDIGIVWNVRDIFYVNSVDSPGIFNLISLFLASLLVLRLKKLLPNI
jgi:hypothetical protein